MFCVGGVYVCLFVGDALVARGRCVREIHGETMLFMQRETWCGS